MKVKYPYFYSYKYKRIFSIVVLNELHLKQFENDMYCPCCNIAKLYFKPNSNTPHLAKYPSSFHSEACTKQIEFFDSNDFGKLSEEEAKIELRKNFNFIDEEKVENLALRSRKIDKKEKYQSLILIDKNFFNNIQYLNKLKCEGEYFIVGSKIKFNYYLQKNNFLTLSFEKRKLLSISYNNYVKEKLKNIITDYEKEYNIAIFGKVIVNGKYNNVRINNTKFIEVW